MRDKEIVKKLLKFPNRKSVLEHVLMFHDFAYVDGEMFAELLNDVIESN